MLEEREYFHQVLSRDDNSTEDDRRLLGQRNIRVVALGNSDPIHDVHDRRAKDAGRGLRCSSARFGERCENVLVSERQEFLGRGEQPLKEAPTFADVHGMILRNRAGLEESVEESAAYPPFLCVALDGKLVHVPGPTVRQWSVRRCRHDPMNSTTYSSAMTSLGRSEVFAEQPSRSPIAASYEFKITMGWPSMLRYISSPMASGSVRWAKPSTWSL